MLKFILQKSRRYTALFGIFYFLFCSLVKEVAWKGLKICYLKSLVESHAIFLDQIYFFDKISSNLKKAALNILNISEIKK